MAWTILKVIVTVFVATACFSWTMFSLFRWINDNPNRVQWVDTSITLIIATLYYFQMRDSIGPVVAGLTLALWLFRLLLGMRKNRKSTKARLRAPEH